MRSLGTDAGGMPLVRRLTNRFMSGLLSHAMGQYVPDTQCGYRLFRCDVVPLVSTESTRYAAESEILLHVANHKTYHRGYVAVVLYQLGGRPPVMDLPVFLRDAPRVLCGAQQEAARSDRTA